jgi:hypothetical protein
MQETQFEMYTTTPRLLHHHIYKYSQRRFAFACGAGDELNLYIILMPGSQHQFHPLA